MTNPPDHPESGPRETGYWTIWIDDLDGELAMAPDENATGRTIDVVEHSALVAAEKAYEELYEITHEEMNSLGAKLGKAEVRIAELQLQCDDANACCVSAADRMRVAERELDTLAVRSTEQLRQQTKRAMDAIENASTLRANNESLFREIVHAKQQRDTFELECIRLEKTLERVIKCLETVISGNAGTFANYMIYARDELDIAREALK